MDLYKPKRFVSHFIVVSSIINPKYNISLNTETRMIKISVGLFV